MNMADKGLAIFPHSLLNADAIGLLAPWFGPLELVMPPGGGGKVQPPDLVSAGLLKILSPEPPLESGAEEKKLHRLLVLWEDWLADKRGGAQAEMLKSGIKPPPTLESVGDIVRGIKDPGALNLDQEEPEPEATAGFIMYLALLQDLRARDADGILEQVEQKQAGLGAILGLDQEDEPAPEYQKASGPGLPPPAYRWDVGPALARLMAAWAVFSQGVDMTGEVLATTSPEAGQLLVERANRRFLANSASPLPGLPLAQGAARFSLPVFAGLPDKALVAMVEAMRQKPGFERLETAWGEIQSTLTGEKWSRRLPEALAGPAGEISRLSQELAGEVGQAGGTREVVLLAFPGLDMAKLMALMRGAGQNLLPPAQDWPDAWPAGSCPLLVVPPA